MKQKIEKILDIVLRRPTTVAGLVKPFVKMNAKLDVIIDKQNTVYHESKQAQRDAEAAAQVAYLEVDKAHHLRDNLTKLFG